MLTQITVYVPDHRVEDFYIRFGEYLADTKSTEAPAMGQRRPIPTWVEGGNALDTAELFWQEVSLPGRSLLLHLARAARDTPASFDAKKLADELNFPKGKSAIAGTLGAVSKAARRAGLPMYTSQTGRSWHYIWDWDGAKYSMEPKVAALLRKASNLPTRDR